MATGAGLFPEAGLPLVNCQVQLDFSLQAPEADPRRGWPTPRQPPIRGLNRLRASLAVRGAAVVADGVALSFWDHTDGEANVAASPRVTDRMIEGCGRSMTTILQTMRSPTSGYHAVEVAGT